MNTKDTPFGESFGNYGDPRRYMGQGISPGKKVEKFVAKVKNSPLAGLMGIGAAGDGKTAPSPVPAPVPASALGQGVAVPTAPSIGVNANIPGAVAPGAAQMPQAAPSVMPTQDLDGDGQIDSFWGVKPVGPQSSVNLQNPTDFNPLAPDTSNQVAVSPDDYRNIPGFGKLQKIAGQFMGMG
jgi:hypothetical protein